ncbi:MAG: Asp-tRNA(Asn)/Glu-tRNA(Gln) amidotransferase subunit GatB [Kiritimatiellae bacterium]|nr:Asp-tRNA(Asn)/Glu-tRNA(Gln) amidotransferase subunit GatB [Kiritimatiellia bacterium]
MKFLATIGLEVHVQLLTRTKMFCACKTDYGAGENTQVCPVCLGYPGALPVINEEAVRLTVLTGLMLGSKINRFSKFDRKNYFYPDMPKNYQISQYDCPFCVGGAVEITCGEKVKKVSLTRIHLEEDVGKNMHIGELSSVDFNRAGHPLMEVVTEPDMASPEEAFAFLLALKQILNYGLVSRCNLEEGNVRCDINCSIRPEGRERLGVKTEIKNLNTFKGVFQALNYEIARQTEVLNSGGMITQETRRWDSERGVTESMRSKEEAHDYRYFPDPDLLPVLLSREQIQLWEKDIPELPRQRCARLARQYAIPEYDAKVLSADKDLADFFEKAAGLSVNPKAVSNFVMTEMLRLLAEKEMEIKDAQITPQSLAELVKLADEGKINSNSAKQIFAALFEKGGAPGRLMEAMGLVQVSDAGEIEDFVRKAMESNPKSVSDYRAGKEAALKYLVGQVMRLSRGKANPQMARELLKQKLG